MRMRGPDDEYASSSRAVQVDRAGLSGSLAFLALGYFLIVAAPLLSTRLAQVLSGPIDLNPAGPWLPAAAAAGVALIGAAAMMLVLSRLVRDVETRPYASVAPVLTVFSGFILMGLRAKLPFAGLASEHIGVFALSLSLCGGALACRDSWGARSLGWALALLPPVAIAFALAALTEHGDVEAALRRADPQVRVFLILLALSSLALAVLGSVAAVLARTTDEESHPEFSAPVLRTALPQPAAYAAATAPRFQGTYPRFDPTRALLPPDFSFAKTRFPQKRKAGVVPPWPWLPCSALRRSAAIWVWCVRAGRRPPRWPRPRVCTPPASAPSVNRPRGASRPRRPPLRWFASKR